MGHLDTGTGRIVANAAESERANFIKRTYIHVAGALATLAILEFILIQLGIGKEYFQAIQGSKLYWIGSFVVFIGISSVANSWAHSNISREKQYMGLALYIATLAIYFLPNFYVASTYHPEVMGHAFLVTMALVVGITFTAFTSKINFSFIGKYLVIGMFVLIGVGISGMLFDFSLGLWYSAAGVLLFAGFVLRDTSKIIYEYHTEQYVAASLSLFASIAFMFMYILQLFMEMGDD